MSKKVRLENLLNAASRHLSKRNCTDTDILRRSKLKLKQTAEQFENSNLLIQKRIISVANCSLSEHEADIQYSRLKAWVESLDEEVRLEMEDILFPAFISLYRKLKSSGNKNGACSFYTRHQSNFLKEPELRKMAERFCSENNNHHFSLELSQETFEVLSNYVARSDHIVLQYLLNTTLEISILCIKGDNKSTNSTMEISSMKSTNQTDASILNGVNEAQELMAAIARMNELPSTLPYPPLKMHTIDTGERKVCSASVSSCHSYLSAGFQDSTIAIWDMKKLKPCAQPQNSSLDLACAIGFFHPSSSSANLPSSNAADPSVTICHGHSGPVYSTTFTSTNTHLLTSSDDTTLRLWDLSSMENTVVYRGHTYPVWATDISGQYFVSGSKDRTCKFWSFERTYPLRILAGHTLDVDCVTFHPNGLYVATGSADSSVRMWSVTEGNMPRTFVGHRGTVLAVAFSPCGYLIASAGEDHRIKIWDIGTSSILFDLAGHHDVVHGLVWISKHILGSYSADGSLRLWDIHHQQPTSVSSGTSSSHAKQFASYSVPSQWKPVHLGRGHRGSLVCVASSD